MSRTEMKRIIECLKIENLYLKERIQIIGNAQEYTVSPEYENDNTYNYTEIDSDTEVDSDTEIDYGDDSEQELHSGLVDDSDIESNNELVQNTPFVGNDLVSNDLTKKRSLENHPKGEDEKATCNNLICVVCMENKACVVNIDCGHLCLCFRCSKEIYSTYGGCPTCRKPYVNLCKVFY